VFTTPRSPELIAAIASALKTDDVTSITDPTALFFRQFAESRAVDPNSLATRDPDLRALSACFASFAAQRDEIDESALGRLALLLLAVAGDKDPSLAAAQRLVEIVPRARLVALPGEDHVSAVSAPAYKDAAASFLRAPSARSV
jgi:pimeloyl-ACP methyl ester carboxylesterase